MGVCLAFFLLLLLPDIEGVSIVTALSCRRGSQLERLLIKQMTPTSNSAAVQ